VCQVTEMKHCHFQEPDVGILGLVLLGRMVPQLKVCPPDAPPYTVVGSANCVSALHAALLRDGNDPASLTWMLYADGDAALERSIDMCAACCAECASN
jgi:hypothetical protein